MKGLRGPVLHLHRWLGLCTAFFLVAAGLTGSLLAFGDTLEAWLAPQLHRSASGVAPLRDPLELHARVARQLAPDAEPALVALRATPGRTLRMPVRPLPDPATGRPRVLDYDEVFVDPATGAIQGRRLNGALRFDAVHIVPLLFRVHCALALPSPWGEGLMGVVALLWALDCLAGAWLTLPTGAAGRRGWWTRWRSAWTLKRGAGSHRRTVDLHRAGGLWLWALLFGLAWSGVMFNLREPVYMPVMRTWLAFDTSYRDVPARAHPLAQPPLDMAAALDVARARMAAFAAQRGLRIGAEELLMYNPARGLYAYWVHSSADLRPDVGNTALLIDAETGAVRGHWLPTGDQPGNTVSNWLGALHMGHVGGWIWRTVLLLAGLAVAVLSGTGVAIWLRKRAARRMARRTGRYTRPPHRDAERHAARRTTDRPPGPA
ncbi:PepSY domain-containing protein [Pseudorhodoferax sp. Leaf274]|uniref:PepSY-associated TM helix domain-containing protein n=1 Tax=Pseudorhodoferax sp. Leaf274 TaxID=1736318 RepID=UPI0009E664D7|nr:PepSY-associated TM helix domain-containing protein [Pseudorhodoferax sp. Leaf274]